MRRTFYFEAAGGFDVSQCEGGYFRLFDMLLRRRASRTLELPAGVNPDHIKANIAKGVLKVTVPKPAPAQVKKVEVMAAA